MTILRTNTIAGIGETFGPLFDGDFEFNSQNYVILPKGTASQSGVLRDITDVVGAGRTFYDNLVLAMPFNAATGFADVSSRNRNPGVYGNTTISTAQSKYYGSSAYFDGSGDYLSIADSDDLHFSSVNFTAECWAYPTDSPSQPILVGQWSGSTGSTTLSWVMLLSNNSNRYLRAAISSTGSGVDFDLISSTSLGLNQWNHCAFVRNGSTFTLYLNGVSVASTTDSDSLFNATNSLTIGASSAGSEPFNGFLQDLRIYKGIAKYTANFTPPDRIAEVGVGFKSGALRYNTDSSKVELYDGSQWTEVQSSRPDLNGGARGVFGGGNAPASNVIDYVTISSTGNAIDFGDLTISRFGLGACSSSTRGIFGGGSTPTFLNTIDYITISSTANAQDFGDLNNIPRYVSSCSNLTRGIFGGGVTPTFLNTIDYITISSTANAQDFGDLIATVASSGSCSSPTRGIFGGGVTPSYINTINFVTISTLGNAQDFGDLISTNGYLSACSNSTRGLFGGGYTPSSRLNIIQYITIASTGNAIDFGDLLYSPDGVSSCSSSTRGVFGGGYIPPAGNNTINYITISTQSNAVDFGDLTVGRYYISALSNAHGGL